jgi:hypothetical protein
LHPVDGGQAAVIPMPSQFREKVGQLGGKSRDLVMVSGVGSYGPRDNLKKTISVDSVEIIKNYELAADFDELALLVPGWLDCQGIPPDRDRLELLASFFIELYPDHLPLPLIVPTPEGNILLEWKMEAIPSADIDLGTMKAFFHSFGENGGQEVEAEFCLDTETDFKKFIDFLSANIHYEP